MNSPDTNVNEICQEFVDRSVLGFKKYGVTTERTDLTFEQWVQHLKEELMDAVVYIHKVQKKRDIEPIEPIIDTDEGVSSDTIKFKGVL